MNQNDQRFPIEMMLGINVLILMMYSLTYSQQSILWLGFFVIERLMTFQYDEEIENSLNTLFNQEEGMKKGWLISLLAITSLGMFVYILFNQIGLIVLIILGEILDFGIKKLKKKDVKR